MRDRMPGRWRFVNAEPRSCVQRLRMWTRIAALTCAVMLAGCGCTGIGCHNVISVAVPTDLLPGVAYEAHACFDEQCEDVVLEATPTQNDAAGHLRLIADQDVIAYELGEGQFDGSHTFKLRVVSPEGQTILEVSRAGELDRTEPNGPWPCGPTCWGLELTVADNSEGAGARTSV